METAGKRKTENSYPQSINNSLSTQGGEISLLDIWRILYSQRYLIFLCVFVTTLASFALTVVLPKVYRSEIIFLPPLSSDIQRLNVPGLFEITADDLYGQFVQNLQSISLQKKFFETHDLYTIFQPEKSKDENVVFLNKFHRLLKVKKFLAANATNSTFVVTLDGENPEQLVEWLNGFVILVDKYTVEHVVGSIMARAEVQAGALKEKIDSLRLVASLRRFDQITALEEATTIAEKLQLHEPSRTIYSYKQEVKGEIGEVTTVKETPSYLRGTKALQAEVEVLKKRKNDDPFISTLRDLQGEMSFYEKIVLDATSLNAARFDQQAVALERPVKPNRNFIIIVGCIIGFILGLLIAFVKNKCLVATCSNV